MQLSEKIGWMRKVKGWSQEDMAERLGMSLNGYAKIERGETDLPLSRLEKISEIFEINLMDLIGLEDRGIFNIASTNCESFNNHIHTLPESSELAHQFSQSQLENKYLKEILEQEDKEIACLRELLDVLRNPPARESGRTDQ